MNPDGFASPVAAEADAQHNARQIKALIEEFRPALIRYFMRRIKAPHEAEDLAHDVFMRLIRRSTITDIKELRSYLFETANSVFIDWTRRNSARSASAHQPIDDTIPAPIPFESERIVCSRQDVERMNVSLQKLPERTRTILLLRRLEGMRHRDIADRMGLSLSTVEKHMQKATLHLAQSRM